jgi:hypothetical protein
MAIKFIYKLIGITRCSTVGKQTNKGFHSSNININKITKEKV